MDLAPSLAFTALHDISEDFRALSLNEGSEAIARFLEDHERFVRMHSGGMVKMGKTDMHTYARIWVKTYFRPDE